MNWRCRIFGHKYTEYVKYDEAVDQNHWHRYTCMRCGDRYCVRHFLIGDQWYSEDC